MVAEGGVGQVSPDARRENTERGEESLGPADKERCLMEEDGGC